MAHRVIDEIIAANEWRDGEFAKFKANTAHIDDSLWCRMCIPMIYAHWEGYVVSAIKVLVEYLNRLELGANQVPTKLVVVCLGDTYRTLSGKQSFDHRVAFTDKFRGLLQSAVKFDKKIDTRSNLNSSVLKEICTMYGFNFARFEDLNSDIDRLVHIRNSIAHGENSFLISLQNVEKYILIVTAATDIFREEIDFFLSDEQYLLKDTA